MELYINFEIPHELEEELSRRFKVVKGGDLSNVEAALVSRLTPEELAKMPRLRFIQVVTAGLDHLPWEHIPPHVVVAGNSGSNADAVAEFALAMLLAAFKKVFYYNEKMRRGDYKKDVSVPVLSGKKVAVLGLGEIGTRVARILAALGAEVWGFSRTPREGPWRFTHRLEDALRDAYAAVCALPLTKHTRGLVKYEHLALMREDAVFVNVGRAEVVDREGALRIVKERPRFIFASDVWWGRHDFSKDAEFFSLPNVIATPWVAGGYGSEEVWRKMVEEAVKNLLVWASGGTPKNIAKRQDYI
ncbi:D-isomer specific 2-hydroxyacid dehydrogenase, NAD-binding protein [Pyrobaculum islandicum DSM 4184]|uniref:D-isomer specific 2-hydroxyacid dehydrogenase, NAD-binding protein n=1 Tax=Pyrobaculum islandicum (strain DSM 4184 / JCM 9189 / GEO3) TaxID=384616 RepID=A1RU50_PYRIL|nr:2-hydroxyacid dehydrogenase [Pyrobaculum islandicum]ABL88482.1 D-isomer specific 2-hydroxyacid dehydrogenase, NAD-binding protein [Pyrobaculum islandicum DSM 4184]